MSLHINAQVVRARQTEIAASTAHPQHTHDVRVANGRAGSKSTSRIRRGAALAAGLCLAVTGTGVATASTGSSKHLSAPQLQYHLRLLEAQGYKPASCMVGSTRMYSEKTHRFVMVKW
ncbi:MAG TPA: hypothetical protein VMG37_09210 [Solirubrobacteraceae bacterium]|nr:hypothetical protein [Solirubrobacteraceae bacterium]